MAAQPTGADAVVRALEHLGVEVAFGLPGVHNLALWRALDESTIRLVGVRHEQAAAYAADGYARTRGTLGVALTTTGPGAANALGAVGEAWASRSPLLVIATDVPTTVRRPGVWRGALHEASDQAAMFAPVVKHSERVPRADGLDAAVQRAAHAALEAPSRPAYVEVPTNLLSTTTAETRPSPWPRLAPPAPADADIDRAVKLLEAARAPLVWAGGGAVASGAGDAVGLLAERLAAPVITTYAARGLLPPGHPCRVGAPPHVPEVGALWDDADLVISIGSDLDAMMTQGWTQPQPPRLVAINIDGSDAAKNYRADLLLRCDAAAGAAALGERIEPRDGLDALAGRLRALSGAVRSELERTDPEPLAFLDAIDQALPDDAVLAVDMCIPGYWLGGFHQPDAPRRMLYPLGWGTLGCAFPQAIGAALAGAAPVVSISGDGGFLYAATELATVAQERVPLTAVIVDDGGYGMLRFDQDLHGDPHVGVNLHTPDFEALAGSFGVRAEAVEGLGEDFGAALARHVALGEPSVLVAKASLRPPPNVSPRSYRTARPPA
jgi:thiamine pyrophosphate-dependent acetolactate synthase large subunit-like protein